MSLNIIKHLNNKLNSRETELKLLIEKLKVQNSELEWAHIFHDTIKNKEWLNTLAISPGRWAANYSLLYILVRILSDFKPLKILEFGLGESSKVISSFLGNELQKSQHLIIEQDLAWIEAFKSRFTLSGNCKVLNLPLQQTRVKEFTVNSYADVQKSINGIFDLYIVDGPFGSENYSRYDICLITQRLSFNDEFVIIIDDYERNGENETTKDLLQQLNLKGLQLYTGVYTGNKSQMVIATEKYRFATSL